MSSIERASQPTREEVDAMQGPVLLEFGASWCGHCLSAAPDVQRLLRTHSDVQHLKVEDGPGKPLGRSFRVKLWPTFVFMRDGEVVDQLVRPSRSELIASMAKLVNNDGSQGEPIG